MEIDGKELCKVENIRKHSVVCGDMQFLVKWFGCDESENLWLTANQLDSAKAILQAYRRQNQLNSAIVYDVIKCAHCDVVHVDTGKYVRFNHVKHVR